MPGLIPKFSRTPGRIGRPGADVGADDGDPSFSRTDRELASERT
jgi:hypothetical protein